MAEYGTVLGPLRNVVLAITQDIQLDSCGPGQNVGNLVKLAVWMSVSGSPEPRNVAHGPRATRFQPPSRHLWLMPIRIWQGVQLENLRPHEAPECIHSSTLLAGPRGPISQRRMN